MSGSNVTPGTAVKALGTGAGGVGTYLVNDPQIVSSGTTLTALIASDQATQVTYAPVPAVGAGSTFTRTVFGPLGKVSVYTWDNSSTVGPNLTVVDNLASTLTPYETKVTYGYNTATGFVASITDTDVTTGASNEETLAQDPRGMATQIVEASTSTIPRTTNFAWDQTWREPDAVFQPGRTTSYVYSSAGRPLYRTQTDTTGQNSPSRTWAYTWNPEGELLTLAGPRGASDTTTFAYNANGYLASMGNQLSQITTVTSWDWRGAPMTVVDPNGVATALAYDIHGRVTSATINPGGNQSQYQFAYTPPGDIRQITLPALATLQYTWDEARRMTQVMDIRGETESFAYDNDDDPILRDTAASNNALAETMSATYDDLGRLTSAIGSTSQTWTLAYDYLDNLLSITDPLSHGRSNTFDALNRVVTQTDPQGFTVQFAFDGLDDLVAMTDGDGLTTSRNVDGFGDVLKEISLDRGTLAWSYDADGNLTSQVDGSGTITSFTYDVANRLIGKAFPSDASEATAYAYDATSGGNYGVGRLTGVTEASGSTAYTYDAQGRITTDAKTINSKNYSVGYNFDPNGKVITITYPSGRLVGINRTNDGLVLHTTTQLNSSSPKTDVAKKVAFEPYGPLLSFSYGANSLGQSRSYSQDYELTNIDDAPTTGSAIMNLSFSWQNDWRISGVTDNASTGRGATYTYTNSGRVLTANGPWGNLSYQYDPSGNRTQLPTGSGVYTSGHRPQCGRLYGLDFEHDSDRSRQLALDRWPSASSSAARAQAPGPSYRHLAPGMAARGPTPSAPPRP